MNKASGGDGIPIELFQILKADAVSVLHSIYASKFGKLCSGHRTGKGVFIPIPRGAIPKNVQKIKFVAQSFPTLQPHGL